jgi:hypothetical protein
MSEAGDEVVLDFYERLLIRKALVLMAYQSNVSELDAERLRQLEHLLKDANRIIVKG